MGFFDWISPREIAARQRVRELEKSLQDWRLHAVNYGSNFKDIRPGLVTIIGEVDGQPANNIYQHTYICASYNNVPSKPDECAIHGYPFFVRSGNLAARVLLPKPRSPRAKDYRSLKKSIEIEDQIARNYPPGFDGSTFITIIKGHEMEYEIRTGSVKVFAGGFPINNPAFTSYDKPVYEKRKYWYINNKDLVKVTGTATIGWEGAWISGAPQSYLLIELV
jgi:hypothetical protein